MKHFTKISYYFAKFQKVISRYMKYEFREISWNFMKKKFRQNPYLGPGPGDPLFEICQIADTSSALSHSAMCFLILARSNCICLMPLGDNVAASKDMGSIINGVATYSFWALSNLSASPIGHTGCGCSPRIPPYITPWFWRLVTYLTVPREKLIWSQISPAVVKYKS